MNYLAHCYLSGDADDVLLGNFIADAVKGSRYKDFDAGIARGILLHRFIDSYTDKHPVVSLSKERLRKNHGLYSGVIVDIIYDHFLAADWQLHSAISLKDYSSGIYKLAFNHFHILPDRFRLMLPYMSKEDWLFSYSKLKGIEGVLKGMSGRIKGNPPIYKALHDLVGQYDFFRDDFNAFFPDMKLAASQFIKESSYP